MGCNSWPVKLPAGMRACFISLSGEMGSRCFLSSFTRAEALIKQNPDTFTLEELTLYSAASFFSREGGKKKNKRGFVSC